MSSGPSRHPTEQTLSTIPPGLANHPDYEILRELGRGGMGVVYLAQNKLMGRPEVLKVVGGHLVERPGVRDRFLREVQSAAKLQHKNIVTAYSAMRLGESIILAMEYVPGDDLAKVVKSGGPLPVINACYFIYQAALGLQHAHERGMVHRDIKPANLIVAREGKKAIVKVLDFGLAKVTSEGQIDSGLTREGQMLGTPDFIAPEQIRDAQSADIRADIYSLGCTFYYLITGRPPFHGDNLWDLYQAHFSMDAGPLNLVRPEVPVELAALVAKMMAKEPARRFQTPGEVARELTRFFKTAAQQPSVPSAEMLRTNPPFAHPPTSQIGHASSSSRPGGPGPAPTKPMTVGAAPVPASRLPSQPNPDQVAWESLIELGEPEPPITPAKPKSRVAPIATPVRPAPWVWASVAAGVVLLGLIVASVAIFKTRNATVVSKNPPAQPVVIAIGDKRSRAVEQEHVDIALGDRTVPAGRALRAPLEVVEFQRDSPPNGAPGSFRIVAPFRAKSPVADGVIVPDEYGPPLEINFTDATNPGLDIWHAPDPSKGPEDLSAELYLAYTRDDLFVAVKVHDNILIDTPAANIVCNDAVELFIDGDRLGGDFRPGSREGFQAGATATGRKYATGIQTGDQDYEVKTAPFAGGYQVVFRIPLATIDVLDGPAARPPGPGSTMRFNLGIVDNDEPVVDKQQRYCVLWTEDRNKPPMSQGDGSWPVDLHLARPVTYELVAGPAELLIDPESGVLTWNAPDQPRTERVTIRVRDVEKPELTALARFTITTTTATTSSGVIRSLAMAPPGKPPVPPAARPPQKSSTRVGPAPPPSETADGFHVLFNGKDLSGWEMRYGHPCPWRVEHGILISSGAEYSHLYSVRNDYRDFHLRVEARINKGGDSGVFFRWDDQKGGYQAQIVGMAGTGGLLFRPTRPTVHFQNPLVSPGRWLLLELIADGDHIVIKVNGKTTADYTDANPAVRSGSLGVEQRLPATVIEFRRIEIKELKTGTQ
jgi:serine/threonine protein kinase